MKRNPWWAIAWLVLALPARGAEAVPELAPLALPADVEQSLVTFAKTCDVLVVGEIHGTQEVPELVAALLAPLDASGYKVLALEVPHDAQPALVAWATGKTEVVPAFFAQPGVDGRGNVQALALIRLALGPPFDWKLICFDQTEQEMMRQVLENLPKGSTGTFSEQAGQLSPEDIVALSVARDAAMAEQLAAATKRLVRGTRVLAICGNLHARIADHSPDDSPVKPFWPSMAAALVRDHPQWRIRSLNAQPFSGEYFNGGEVNRFGDRPLENIKLISTPEGDWDAELRLPHATVATFLAPPRTMEHEGESDTEESDDG
jgi:hypothetical protein